MVEAAKSRWKWLVLGVVVGLGAALLVPASPLQAVGNAQSDDFVICTAAVDQQGEMLFTLDSLTGDLSGISINTNGGGFNPPLRANVAKDLKLQPGKKPKFLMVPGSLDLQTQAGQSFADMVLYVVETSSGMMMMYGIPLDRSGGAGTLVPLLPQPLAIRAATRN